MKHLNEICIASVTLLLIWLLLMGVGDPEKTGAFIDHGCSKHGAYKNEG